jgi:methylated-DNA-protein-cysteine methyltransferase-like protein
MRESKRRAAATHGQPVAERKTGFPESFPRIWAQIAAVPAGSIASYGEIARRAGLPRRARLVAQALCAVPDEMALPWHRILRADGRIAFAPGSAAFKRQKRLLETEGVSVSRNGKATTVQTQEGDDLDAAIWR